ncbi:hypothetical protein P154DRAFT_624740 [Amniculicola lignicola CBS 123094]|uniref:Myb-like domain-containing protein n=1 Tax=Amniculicola lignicola CBS 123094 TaxID=1392246 RepID=A0A6A5W0M2_9PLEO|nr:hypothetical protein P154DRAFT_624740 [Amniculicola lignicola CBS 123094]
MKKNNETWKVIAEALSKDTHACQERFKEIRPKDFRPNPQVKGNKKGKGGKGKWADEKKDEWTKDEEKNEKTENDDTTIMKPSDEEQWDQAAKAFNITVVSPDEKKEITGAIQTLKKVGIEISPNLSAKDSLMAANLAKKLVPDDTFSAGDLKLLAELVAQDNRRVYRRLATRFEEVTGRKVGEKKFMEKITEVGKK